MFSSSRIESKQRLYANERKTYIYILLHWQFDPIAFAKFDHRYLPPAPHTVLSILISITCGSINICATHSTRIYTNVDCRKTYKSCIRLHVYVFCVWNVQCCTKIYNKEKETYLNRCCCIVFERFCLSILQKYLQDVCHLRYTQIAQRKCRRLQNEKNDMHN